MVQACAESARVILPVGLVIAGLPAGPRLPLNPVPALVPDKVASNKRKMNPAARKVFRSFNTITVLIIPEVF